MSYLHEVSTEESWEGHISGRGNEGMKKSDQLESHGGFCMILAQASDKNDRSRGKYTEQAPNWIHWMVFRQRSYTITFAFIKKIVTVLEMTG